MSREQRCTAAEAVQRLRMRFMGHSIVRVTQDVYLNLTTDAYDRFRRATARPRKSHV